MKKIPVTGGLEYLVSFEKNITMVLDDYGK